MPAAGNMLGDKPGASYGFRKCCEAVRDGVPIEGIARRYTDLEPLGSSAKARFRGRCPLPDHAEKTPSFYIYPPGRWWCYGCDRGGDVVDLEFHCGDYSELWEAMITLAGEFGVELPQPPPSWFRRQERQKPVRDAIEDALLRRQQRRVFAILWREIGPGVSDDERQAEVKTLWREAHNIARLVVAGRRAP